MSEKKSRPVQFLYPGSVSPIPLSMKKCKRCDKDVLVSKEGFSFETPEVEKELKENLRSVCMGYVTDEEWKVIADSRNIMKSNKEN